MLRVSLREASLALLNKRRATRVHSFSRRAENTIALPCCEAVLREAKPRALGQEARFARFFLSLGRGGTESPCRVARQYCARQSLALLNKRLRISRFARVRRRRLRAPLTRGLLRGITPSRSPCATRTMFCIRHHTKQVCYASACYLKSTSANRDRHVLKKYKQTKPDKHKPKHKHKTHSALKCVKIFPVLSTSTIPNGKHRGINNSLA